MKKIVLAFSLFIAVIFSINEAKANVGSGFYVSPRFALAIHDQSKLQVGSSPLLDGSGVGFGISGGLAIGYDKQYSTSYMPIRLEAEALFRTNSSYKVSFTNNNASQKYQQDIRVSTYFLNAYYDFHSAGSFVPYIGGGIGYAHINNKFTKDNTFEEDTSSQLAYNLGLGVSWLVQAGFGLDIGYRYTLAGKSNIVFNNGYTSNVRPHIHELVMGVRLTF